jgi:hypothetical protein
MAWSLVLQGGWAGQLIGIDTETPMPAFIPVLMFAVLFGLSMDYQVFLLSRMRESWLRTNGHGARAVADGLAGTGRVITAAAAIMVAVFAAFVPSPEVTLKVIGAGMAAAIAIDATVVRMLLVPRSCTCRAGRTGGCPDRSTGGFPSCGSRDVPTPSSRVRGPRRTTPAAASRSRQTPPTSRASASPVRDPRRKAVGPRTCPTSGCARRHYPRG